MLQHILVDDIGKLYKKMIIVCVCFVRLYIKIYNGGRSPALENPLLILKAYLYRRKGIQMEKPTINWHMKLTQKEGRANGKEPIDLQIYLF